MLEIKNLDTPMCEKESTFALRQPNPLLKNLFRLDGNPTKVGAGNEVPNCSPGETIRNVIFEQDGWANSAKQIRDVTFENVSFSKLEISKVTFKDCTFKDCLFLGTQLTEVEFHGCQFYDCNLWKADFKQVYLDPTSLHLGRRFRNEAQNVGVTVFQALLANFADERQDEFYMEADIRFRRWKRYQIWWTLSRERISAPVAWWRWSRSLIYECVAGFGYRPFRFFVTTIALFFAVSYLNYVLIADAITVGASETGPASYVDTVYFTFSILTVLGFSSILPETDFAKLLTVFQALLAVGWLGMFTSILVKRFLR